MSGAERLRPASGGRTAGAVALISVLLAGCTPAIYHYRAANGGCDCTEFRVDDEGASYLVRASYRMDHGVTTDIELELINRSGETLSTGLATVMVSSVNVQYQYNNKSMPMPVLVVPPHSSRTVTMVGRDVSDTDDWHKIAGERLTLTIRGITIGGRELRGQEVVLIPENPRLKR